MALRYTAPYFLWVDGDGVPAAGWFLHFFESGTDTPLATYSNTGLTIANTNPVEANADGYWGPIFLQAEDYKVVLKDENDVQIWVADPVAGSTAQDDSSAIQLQAGNYAVDTGAINVYEATLTPAPASYAAIVGAPIRILIANPNSGNSTLELNGLGPKTIVRASGTGLFPTDLRATGVYTFIYTGVQFVCQELSALATMGQAQMPDVTVPDGGVATTIATVGQTNNTGKGLFEVHYDQSGNVYMATVSAAQGAGTLTPSNVSTGGTPGTVAFTMSGTNLQMARTGGPASVTVRVTQLSS